MWSLLLLAVTVWSFAHFSLGLSDGNITRRKWKSVDQICASWKWRSKCTVNTNSKLLLDYPTITVLVAALTQKRSMTWNCWHRIWLAGTGLLTFAGKPTKNVTVKYLKKRHGLCFFNGSHLFFLTYAQKNQTYCTYVWWHKDVKTQREDHIATRSP